VTKSKGAIKPLFYYLALMFGDNLKRLRKARGLTQLQLSEAAGVKRQSIANYESSRNYPSLDNLITIADFFGVSIEEIVRQGKSPAKEEIKRLTIENERLKHKIEELERRGQ
jgi:transcriptional regulator with XRE-family HTH domain